MSKIFNVRLPDAGVQYNAVQFNQLVRSLEQIVLQLNNTYTSTINDDNAAALTYFEAGGSAGPLDGTETFSLPYATFIDRTTRTAALINTAYPIPMEIQQLSNGVYRDPANNSRVYVDVPGVYNFQFSAQVAKSSGGAADAWFWPRVNGQDIGASATKVTVQGSVSAAVAAWNFVLDLDGGDYFELVWAVSNTGVVLLAEAATAFCPSIPSLILTVTYVSTISEIGPSVRVNLIGVQGTGGVGQVFAPGYLLTGVQGNGYVGAVVTGTVAPQGAGGSGAVGSVLASGEATVEVGSVSAYGEIGQLVIGTVAVNGVQGTGQVGSVVTGTVGVGGVTGTGAIGVAGVLENSSTTASSVSGAGGVGSATVQADVTVNLSGVVATGALGTINVTV